MDSITKHPMGRPKGTTQTEAQKSIKKLLAGLVPKNQRNSQTKAVTDYAEKLLLNAHLSLEKANPGSRNSADLTKSCLSLVMDMMRLLTKDTGLVTVGAGPEKIEYEFQAFLGDGGTLVVENIWKLDDAALGKLYRKHHREIMEQRTRELQRKRVLDRAAELQSQGYSEGDAFQLACREFPEASRASAPSIVERIVAEVESEEADNGEV